MNKIIYAASIIYYFFFAACTDGERRLGNGYFLATEGRYSAIIYTSEMRNAVGLTVVKGNVFKFNYDESIIIAERRDVKDGKLDYWLIDKDIELDLKPCGDKWSALCDSLSAINRFQFEDSLRLYKTMKQRQSKLRLVKI